MRKALAVQSGLRKKFRATFDRIGKKTGYRGRSEDTILLLNVKDYDTGRDVADHIWFAYTSGFEKAGITPGDVVVFEARVKAYKKGYVNSRLGIRERELDYKLSHPTQIRVLKE